MNETTRKQSSRLAIDNLNNIPMLSIMENSGTPWCVKDKESQAVYMNKACKEFLILSEHFDYEGRKDEDFPCPWAELSDEFYASDRKAESSPCGAEFISTSYYEKCGGLQPIYCYKFGLYNTTGEVLGTMYYAKEFSFLSLFDFFKNLKPSVITFNPPVDLFTERELEIIFYALQKIPSKEIAPMLCISHRTVENRLLKIYEKAGANSIKGLIEYCHNVGLNNYVPKKLLREGVNFCW